MAKAKKTYECNDCGTQSLQWSGQCLDCGAWNSMHEIILTAKSAASTATGYSGNIDNKVYDFAQISISDLDRYSTDISELDRALGGGLVAGSVVLIGGDPGIGKSTLLLQVLAHLSQKHSALYVTGEESLQQVVMRAKRLGFVQLAIKLLSEVITDNILNVAYNIKPNIIVIDSIQTLCVHGISSAPGSVSQVRESAARLVQYAKQNNTAIFIVGHVTKDGAIAGPRVLEHMVDTVLYFEGNNTNFRVLRAVKNRFGAVNELGIFTMSEKGLREVDNPSAIFLSDNEASPGSAVTAIWEGTRPMLIEVQSLVDKSYLANPRRMAVGIDQNRLGMILAVLSKHLKIFTHDQDVFVNVVGGVKINETAADLAIAAAILSSLNNQLNPRHTVIFGEIGLAGELRPAPNAAARLKDAVKHGFTHAIVPHNNLPHGKFQGLQVKTASSLQDALMHLS